MKKLLAIVYVMLTFLVFTACHSTKNAADKKETTGQPDNNNTGTYLSLMDYLRRFPSVRITGTGDDSKVVIRSADTLSGDSEPLFVIDKNTFANSYAQAVRMVDVNDIKSVNVMNSLEGNAAYGMRGARGVIVIKTKTGK